MDSIKFKLDNFKRELFFKIPFLLRLRMPKIIVVETTNVCMLKCPTCPTANAMSRPRGFMDLKLFSLLLNQITWNIDKLDFGYSGEPLLNKDIFRMIEMASKRGIPTGFDTNGMELSNFVEEIITSGLRYITVSIDGASQVSLAHFRKGAQLEKIENGVKKLCARKNKLNSKFPKITLQTIVMKHNEKELNIIKSLATDWGVDQLIFKSLNLNIGFWMKKEERDALAREYLPADIRYSRYSPGSIRGPKKSRACIFPLNDMIILYNGDVILCCLDFNAKYKIGNILKTPLKEIWQSKIYDDYRKMVYGLKLDMCSDCDFSEYHNKILSIKK